LGSAQLAVAFWCAVKLIVAGKDSKCLCKSEALFDYWCWTDPWLDLTRARRTLINLLCELPITMLVSTHDMKLVEELFPRTIVMDESVIVADGKTNDILEDEKFLNEYGLEKP